MRNRWICVSDSSSTGAVAFQMCAADVWCIVRCRWRHLADQSHSSLLVHQRKPSGSDGFPGVFFRPSGPSEHESDAATGTCSHTNPQAHAHTERTLCHGGCKWSRESFLSYLWIILGAQLNWPAWVMHKHGASGSEYALTMRNDGTACFGLACFFDY